jgi:hypothetical protein
MSRDQTIFVDHATDASLSSYAVPVEIDRSGKGFQRRSRTQGAVRLVLIERFPSWYNLFVTA